MNPKVGGLFESPSCRDIFCLKNVNTFKNTRSCVENECCFPRTVNNINVNFTSKYLYRQTQYSKTWDGKCLAHISQMDRAFGMNPKVGGSSPLRSRHFLSQKRRHFHKNTRSCVENECCCPRAVNISTVNLKISNHWLLDCNFNHAVLYIRHASSILP